MTTVPWKLAVARLGQLLAERAAEHSLDPVLDLAAGTERLPHAHPAQEPPRPRVRLQIHDTPTTAVPGPPSGPSAAELRAGLALTPGAARLHELLHDLAHDVLSLRGHRALPGRLVFHLPALLLAAELDYTDRHVRRLALELERAGLIAYGGHATRVKGQSLWDGTLWAVKLVLEAEPPTISAGEWRHSWRDLARDFETGTTAMSEVQGRQTGQSLYACLKSWAFGARGAGIHRHQTPVCTSSDMDAQELVYTLPAISDAHPRQRAQLVSQVAAGLARHLRDDHSVNLYAHLLHQALAAEHRGQPALDQLAHAVQRVLIDIAEWPGLERPGALLVARLKISGVWDALA